MTITEKIQKANEKFDLSAIEVRKIMSAAKKRNRGKLVTIESWFAEGKDEFGFRRVFCLIMDPIHDERLDDVVIHCCMFDRRKSFVQ